MKDLSNLENSFGTIMPVSVHEIECDIASWPKRDNTWTLGERALLVELYIKSIGLSSKERDSLCAELSTLLRNAAETSGLSINEKYRNIAGIRLQSYSVEYIFTNGKTGVSSPSKSTLTVCELYKNDRPLFNLLIANIKAHFNQLLGNNGDNTINAYLEASISSGENMSFDIVQIEKFLQKADLAGMTVNEIVDQLSSTGCRTSSLRTFLDDQCWAILMPNDKYIHRDSFIELDDAAYCMEQILYKQFSLFYGYTNSTTFFNAVKNELSMFLNDSKLFTAADVYCLAKYLFSKTSYNNNIFYFHFNTHIFQEKPVGLSGNTAVTINFIQHCGGIATKEKCIDYLNKLSLSSSNINNYLNIAENKDVLFYDHDKYVLTKLLELNENALNQIAKTLALPLDGMPFIIPRQLNDVWFSRLPQLANGLQWDLLLLQQVVEKYLPQYRTIAALEGQELNRIKAGIVIKESIIASFADLIHAYITEELKLKLPMRFSYTEFRDLLLESGMISGNELYYIAQMQKAIDSRFFAWSSCGNSVLILEK